jgi:hypothetical protein
MPHGVAHDFFARVLSGGGFEVRSERDVPFLPAWRAPAFLADQRDRAGRLKQGNGIVPDSLDAPAGTKLPPVSVADSAMTPMTPDLPRMGTGGHGPRVRAAIGR